MRIALINPPPRTEYERHWARFPVLGLAYVAAALRARGHEVTLLDGKLAALTTEQILARVVALRPELIGITCMTVEYPMAARIAEQIKERTSAPIIVGGAHVNAVKARALEECAAIDLACIDEGEHLVCEVAQALSSGGDLSAIDGLAFRRDGAIVVNTKRGYPLDYDSLPFPAWDLFAVGEQIPILTHRGCPFQCTFCGHNSGFKPRYRTPENVLSEIEEVVERFQPRVIRFEDETFGLNLPRTKKILNGILARGLQHKVRFSAQTRVDRIDLDFIRLLKACQFETLELGVESGNPQVLERIKKGITLDQVERAVKLARAEGVKVWCKFILGHPDETVSDMLDTVRFIARTNPDQLSISVMTPFPGTPIFEMAVNGEGGYRLLSDDWQQFDKYASGVLELENVSLGQLKALQLAAYLTLYLRNGRLRDLVGILAKHRHMALEMAVDTARHLLRPKPSEKKSRPRPRSVGLGEEWYESGGVERPATPVVPLRAASAGSRLNILQS
jgi:radical SAM superfamily enzyme YgiQ (UPF0313 family)